MKIFTAFIIAFILSGCGGNSQTELPYDMNIANKGYNAMLNQEYDIAEAFFELALSVNPENPYALLNLGVVYQNTERFEEAKKMYQKVIDLNTSIKAIKTTDKSYQGQTLSEIARKNLRSLEK
jgi:tetratricopeptide (TPR) repeat protein